MSSSSSPTSVAFDLSLAEEFPPAEEFSLVEERSWEPDYAGPEEDIGPQFRGRQHHAVGSAIPNVERSWEPDYAGPEEDMGPQFRGRRHHAVGSAIPNVIVVRPPSRESVQDQGTYHREQFEAKFKNKLWRGIDDLVPMNPSSTRRALVIAIGYGGRSPPAELPGTYIDAHRVVNMLGKLGYQDDEIFVLADMHILDEYGDPELQRLPSRSNIVLEVAGHGHRQVTRQDAQVEGCQWVANEGIMPSDIDFQRFNPCEGCQCSDTMWDNPNEPQTSGANSLLVPNPVTILWDYVFNETLAKNLQPGTKLTVMLDCCHSGGTVRNTLHNGTNTTEAWRSRPGQGVIKITDTILPESLERPLAEGDKSLFGNLLGLPALANLDSSTPVTIRPRGNTVPACQLLSDANVRQSSVSFHEQCEVICWAACTDVQRALETDDSGGRFTKAFTDYINTHNAHEGTYRGLNRHIKEIFDDHNSVKNLPKSGTQAIQHPQVYATTNVSQTPEYFNRALDI